MRHVPGTPGFFLVPLLVACSCSGGGETRVSSAARAATIPAAETSATSAPTVPASPDVASPDSDPSFETVLAPLHDVEVRARTAGQVMAVDVEEGERVAAGARLAQLEDREPRATLDECEAEVARRTAAWERAQKLHGQQVIADEQFITVRSEWQIAAARRDRAAAEWERCRIVAPFAGVVALRRVQVGQMIRENDLLFRISDPDRLRAELLLPESRLGTVRVGQAVRLIPAAGAGPVGARVTRVSSLVDPASGAFRVVIDVDNRNHRLPAGVSVRVAFEPAGN